MHCYRGVGQELIVTLPAECSVRYAAFNHGALSIRRRVGRRLKMHELTLKSNTARVTTIALPLLADTWNNGSE